MGRRRRHRLGAPLRPPASGGWCGSALWSCGSRKSLPLSEPGSERATLRVQPGHGTPRKAPEQGPAHGRELAGHVALGLHVSQVTQPCPRVGEAGGGRRPRAGTEPGSGRQPASIRARGAARRPPRGAGAWAVPRAPSASCPGFLGRPQRPGLWEPRVTWPFPHSAPGAPSTEL